MADTVMQHPVTGAVHSVAKKDMARYEENGWVDTTPYDFADTSSPAPEGTPASDKSSDSNER